MKEDLHLAQFTTSLGVPLEGPKATSNRLVLRHHENGVKAFLKILQLHHLYERRLAFSSIYYKPWGLFGGPKACNVNPGGVHDLRMDGGLPPGFLKATLF